MPRDNEKKQNNERKKKVVIPSGVRIPPQNVDAERSVLGAILIDKDAIIKVADIVRPEDFYEFRHETIFSAMLELFDKRQPIDIITLSETLEAMEKLKEIGGSSYLADIVNSTPSASNIVYYAQIVRDKAVLRRLIESSGNINQLGYDEDADISDTLDKAEQLLFAVSQKFMKEKFTAVKDVLTEAFDRIDKIHKDKDKGAIRGVPSGFRDLDNITAGFQNSDLLILAARPSMGKTSFALNLAEHAAIEEKIPVGIFSLEMSKEQLVDRLLASQAGVDSWKLRTGNLSDEDFPKIGYAMGVLSEAPLFIDDTPGANVMEIRAKARRLQMEHGLGLVIIDYLQLMEGKSHSGDSNRVQEISEISRSLKGLARELKVPVIALSQLSRAVEHRPDKRPQLSDLRESGSIEQDADIVMFLYREEYYEPETSKKGITEVLIKKHRNGPTGGMELFFQPEQMRFRDLERARSADISPKDLEPVD
ncbi:MAG: replicative DNA helicase [Patescibacteria group bacterium]